MNIINQNDMPTANGHYSTCIEHNGILYLSGVLAINPETKALENGVELQTKRVLKNVERILTAAGSSKEKVLQVRIYLSNIINWEIVNTIYAEFFGKHKPVRTIIPVSNLHYGSLLEIEITAVQ